MQRKPIVFTEPHSAPIEGYEFAAPGILVLRDDPSVGTHARGIWPDILAHLAPGAVLAGRTAQRTTVWQERGRDGREIPPGWVLAYHPDFDSPAAFSLPGLEIRIMPGPGAMPGDIPMLQVHIPSEARKALDILTPSVVHDGGPPAVDREEVEWMMHRLHEREGDRGVRSFVRRAALMAPRLERTPALARLREIANFFLKGLSASVTSRVISARRRSVDPFDIECVDRMRSLAVELSRAAVPVRPDPHAGGRGRELASFAEAYFSNFVEGNRFAVDEARAILLEELYPDGRRADVGDLHHTFEQLVAFERGCRAATDARTFMEEVKSVNARLLDERREERPGRFKSSPNYAGNTRFVMPGLVEGTLKEGFALLEGLEGGFARGVFLHTLVTAVHPFTDGNGRTARILMTRELVSAGECRITVPTIFHSDYIGGLRALSREDGHDAAPLVRAMSRAQAVTALTASDTYDGAVRLWASANGFLEDERAARLGMPDPTAEIEWVDGVPATADHWRSLEAGGGFAAFPG